MMSQAEERQKRLLIVDDCQATLAAMLRLLCGAGHEVLGANSAEEGLQHLKEMRPDLILMDVLLPGMSGLDATRIIKSDPDFSSTFVVNMSAQLSSKQQKIQSLEAGADGYITRPISNQELLTSVNAYLRLKNMMDALSNSEQRLRSIIDQNTDGMLIVNHQDMIVFANPAAAKLFRCPINQLIGNHFKWIKLSDKSPSREIDVDLSGTGMPNATLEIQATAFNWDGEPAFLVTLHDITARKTAEKRIHQLAYYDELTALPNRFLFMDRLKHALSLSERSGIVGALLFLDLDNFKTLNDTLGHALGDQLLRQVATRITSCVRESDTVGRLGGDEFVILISELSKCAEEAATQAEIACEKILAAFKEPFKFDHHQHNTSASIGVALFTDKPITVDELMTQADLSMYQAKAAGRNTLRFFDPLMQQAVSTRVRLEKELREALIQKAFFLHYQPQVDNHCHVTGAEALVRWQHPLRGIVLPDDFIELAEETGLILQLGQVVIESACHQLALWNERSEMAGLTIAVNISARQFHHPDFLAIIDEAIAHSGANPNKLKLELTESMLLENTEETINKMVSLQAKGIRFSLDDFGTGYSSLSYLKRLPLDQLKIDQSFVKDLVENNSDVAIARTIVTLAHSLGLAVIAEGVETKEQHKLLLQEGCEAFQGNLFSRSVPIEQLEELILA
jgi:diguanylate cyclase (GGDEF)-like protein